MASKSSRRKSASNDSCEEIACLLRNEAHRDPSAELLRAADHLKELGLARPMVREYVLCADPQDRDYPPPRNRHCQGRIYIEENLDEPGHDYRCPECERPVFPQRLGKRRHKELRAKINPEGVKAYVRNELAKLRVDVKDVAEGAFRVDLGDMGVILCILDYCSENRFHSRDWAKTNPTCYLIVDSAHAERLLPEEWLTKVALADIIVGKVSLVETLNALAISDPPASMVEASVPVYSKTVSPIIVEKPSGPGKQRRFLVEVGPKTVRIEGEEVVAPQAGIRLEVFLILWEQFLDDLNECRDTDDFTPLKLSDIIKKLEERKGKDIEDENSIRRAINRLQSDIEAAFKRKVGDPMNREDIIQTCPWKGHGNEHGYRINPRTVCISPFQKHPA